MKSFHSLKFEEQADLIDEFLNTLNRRFAAKAILAHGIVARHHGKEVATVCFMNFLERKGFTEFLAKKGNLPQKENSEV